MNQTNSTDNSVSSSSDFSGDSITSGTLPTEETEDTEGTAPPKSKPITKSPSKKRIRLDNSLVKTSYDIDKNLPTRVLGSFLPLKGFKCIYCDYSCKNLKNITYHIDSHIGIKSFTCEYCKFSTSWSQSFKKHKCISE
jgi:hypothetical protein